MTRERPSAGPLKILVVDDSPEDRSTYLRYLGGSGYQVSETGLGQDGLTLIASNPPDCILLDYRLPDMDGLEFLHEHRAQGGRCAVVMLTGHSQAPLAVEAMKLGAEDFLSKDRINAEALRRAISYSIDKVAIRRQVEAKQQELELALASVAELNRTLEHRVTDRTQELSTANAELSRISRLLQASFDCSGYGILTLDLDLRIRYANRAAHQLLGVRPLLGLGAQEFFAFDELPRLRERLRQRSENRSVDAPGDTGRTADQFEEYEISVRRHDGGGLIAATSVASLSGGHGNDSAWVLMFHDVTRRKELERELIEHRDELSAANAELLRAARMKDQFLASMSHELRTPLTGVLGMSEALLEGVYGELNPRQTRGIQLIESSGRHLLELINDVLDLSKIEAQALDLQLEPCALDSLCAAAVALVHSVADQKGMRIEYASTGSSAQLLADARRAKQILVNLLGNAVKYTPHGGRVGLDVTLSDDRETAAFAVWDTGVGISRADMNRIFQPFVQLDDRLAREQGGTGLGLSLAQRLVKLHGGSLEVESRPGQGSRFTLRLPLATGAMNSADAESAPCAVISGASHWRGAVVVIAGDAEIDIARYRPMLDGIGLRVVAARSGGEALERAAQEHPRLILIDLELRRPDGFETARRIRVASDTRLSTVPIIGLSGLLLPGDRERALDVGCNVFLPKPVSSPILIAEVCRLLDPGAAS